MFALKMHSYISTLFYIPVSYCWTTSIPVVTIGNNTLRDHFVGVDNIQDSIHLRLKVNNTSLTLSEFSYDTYMTGPAKIGHVG